jgi:hypothetical protein
MGDILSMLSETSKWGIFVSGPEEDHTVCTSRSEIETLWADFDCPYSSDMGLENS